MCQAPPPYSRKMFVCLPFHQCAASLLISYIKAHPRFIVLLKIVSKSRSQRQSQWKIENISQMWYNIQILRNFLGMKNFLLRWQEGIFMVGLCYSEIYQTAQVLMFHSCSLWPWVKLDLLALGILWYQIRSRLWYLNWEIFTSKWSKKCKKGPNRGRIKKEWGCTLTQSIMQFKSFWKSAF